MTIGHDLAQIAKLFKPRFFQAPDLPVVLAVALPTEAARNIASFPACALPEAGRIASGRGLSEHDALRTSLGEAAELVSCCRWGDNLCTFDAIPDAEQILPTRDVFGFSPEQEAVRERWNDNWGDDDPWPEILEDPEQQWVCGKSQTSNAPAWISAEALFIGGATGGAQNPLGSTGCASGPTRAAAIEAGLMELVERDAVGRWWWQKRPLHALPDELLDPCRDLRAALQGRHRVTRLAMLESPYDIPCVAAFSHEQDGRFVACGFSADHDWHRAAISAALELADSEFRLRISSQSEENSALRRWMRGMSASDTRFHLGTVGSPPSWSETGAFERVAEEAIVFDMTRPQILAPAVRVFRPGFFSQQPRFRHWRAGDALLSDLLASDETGPAALPLLV